MSNPQSRYIVLIGGVLVGCLLWEGMLAAQACDKEEETNPPTTSAPEENLQGSDEIDYEHAQPMPMPSLPSPPPSETLPEPPSTESPSPPGYSPGSVGTGKKTPKILAPPKPLSELIPTNDADSAKEKV
ncbi:MAG TPA: hypothetical protein VNN62_02740 [Methylomirabilota bacterium]|nr:hypothetical protein [Methylomirabilota bacterium]